MGGGSCRAGHGPLGGLRVPKDRGGTRSATLTGPQVLDVLQRIEAKGRVETAHRVKESLGAIFRYVVATHRAYA